MLSFLSPAEEFLAKLSLNQHTHTCQEGEEGRGPGQENWQLAAWSSPEASKEQIPLKMARLMANKWFPNAS